MARKPATIELAGGKSPRQRIWERIREVREFTVVDLRNGIPGPIPYATVRTYVQSLFNAGYLDRQIESLFDDRGQCKGDRTTYLLRRDTGIEAPRVTKDGSPVTMGLAQEQMWNTLHRLGDLSARELAHHASTEAAPVAEISARDYLRHLAKAGYVHEVRPGKGRGNGGIQAKYRLIKRTGPRPPMVQRCNAIYDPNLHKVVWPTADAMVEAIDG